MIIPSHVKDGGKGDVTAAIGNGATWELPLRGLPRWRHLATRGQSLWTSKPQGLTGIHLIFINQLADNINCRKTWAHSEFPSKLDLPSSKVWIQDATDSRECLGAGTTKPAKLAISCQHVFLSWGNFCKSHEFYTHNKLSLWLESEILTRHCQYRCRGKNPLVLICYSMIDQV